MSFPPQLAWGGRGAYIKMSSICLPNTQQMGSVHGVGLRLLHALSLRKPRNPIPVQTAAAAGRARPWSPVAPSPLQTLFSSCQPILCFFFTEGTGQHWTSWVQSSEAEDALPSSAACWCFLAHAVPYPSKCQSRAGALAPSGALHAALVALHGRLPQQLLPVGSWGSDPSGPLGLWLILGADSQ